VIKRIEDHNRLNGYLFVTIEFVVIAAVLAPFGIYWLSHRDWVLGAIAVGIFVNCLVVVARAVRGLVRREPGVGLWKIYTDTATRHAVAASYPNLSADTFVVAIAALLPFVLAAAVAREALVRGKAAQP
jgi:hypothetical protein